MRAQYLLALTAILATASVQAGIHVGANGVQVGNISVGQSGINVSGNGGAVNDKASYTCTAKNPNVSISGVNRTVTIKGACKTITVNGTNNTVTAQQANGLHESGTNNDITINKVNSISVKGVNSEVEYGSGLTVKKPAIQVTGVNASVNVL